MCFSNIKRKFVSLNQMEIFDNSEFNSSSISFRLFPILNMFVSSANNIEVVEEHIFPRSFMYNRNNNGPNIDPWGTPHVILFTGDDTPLYVTNCLRLDR